MSDEIRIGPTISYRDGERRLQWSYRDKCGCVYYNSQTTTDKEAEAEARRQANAAVGKAETATVKEAPKQAQVAQEVEDEGGTQNKRAPKIKK